MTLFERRVILRPCPLIVVAQFEPREAWAQYEEWRTRNAALLDEVEADDIRIDTGRASEGDFVRVWLPAVRRLLRRSVPAQATRAFGMAVPEPVPAN